MVPFFARRLIVFPRLQYLFLGMFASFGLLCATSTVLISNMFNAPEEQSVLSVCAAVLTLTTGALVLFYNLYLTNRFLGPLFRLNQEIKQALADGSEPQPFCIRKGDYNAELAENFSRLMIVLGKRS